MTVHEWHEWARIGVLFPSIALPGASGPWRGVSGAGSCAILYGARGFSGRPGEREPAARFGAWGGLTVWGAPGLEWRMRIVFLRRLFGRTESGEARTAPRCRRCGQVLVWRKQQLFEEAEEAAAAASAR